MTRNHDPRPGGPEPDRDPRLALLTRLNRLNPTGVVLGTLALFLAVLLLPDPVGGALVLLIAAGLGWLLTRTWPVLAPGSRGMRLLVIGLLVAVALLKLLA